MLTNQSIICISTQEWADLWTRKQRFMSRFARQGNRVLYIEVPVHILGYIRHFRHFWKRAFLWAVGARCMGENLYIYTPPIVLPAFQVFSFVNKINHYFLVPLIKRQIKRLGMKTPILWLYAPYGGEFIGRLGEKFTLYECVDEFTALKGLVRGETVRLLENETIRKSNLIIVTAQALYDSRKELAKAIYLVPNAADIEHFRKAAFENTKIATDIEKIRKPIIGFLGSISYWIDIDLIQYIAISKPEWSVVLIGPIRTDVSKIRSLSNVYLLGRKDYEQVPNYVKAFDVCINPYVMDDVAEGCSPLKLYEYLATGKPIVSVDMPEARKFEGLVRIARTREEVVFEIEAALKENGELAKKRMKESEKHSWDERFHQVESIVEEVLNANSN